MAQCLKIIYPSGHTGHGLNKSGLDNQNERKSFENGRTIMPPKFMLKLSQMPSTKWKVEIKARMQNTAEKVPVISFKPMTSCINYNLYLDIGQTCTWQHNIDNKYLVSVITKLETFLELSSDPRIL